MDIATHSALFTATALTSILLGYAEAHGVEDTTDLMPTHDIVQQSAPPTAASVQPPLNERQTLSVYAHWDTDLINNLKGGINTGSVLDSVAVAGITIRGDDLGLPNSLVNLSAMGIRTGHASNNLVGDSLGASNIEGTRNRLLLDTAFWQQNWFTHPGFRFNTRLGLFDLNSEFTTTDNAAQLLNGSFGPDPTMTGNFTASSFPLNGTGIVATVDNGTGQTSSADPALFTLKLGIIQGEVNHQTQPLSQGTLNILESEWRPHEDTSFKIGLWRKRGNGAPNIDGMYFNIENNLFRGGESTVSGFLRAGAIHGKQSDDLFVDRYFSLGINWQSPVTARPNDLLTLGIGQVQFHRETHHEQLIELAYIYQVNQRVFLQPDLQYINHPSGVLPAAWVATLRIHIE